MEQLVSSIIYSLNNDLLRKELGITLLLSRIKMCDINHTFNILVDTKNNGNFAVDIKELNGGGEIYFSTYFRKINENKKFLNLTGRKGILFLCIHSKSKYRSDYIDYIISDYNNVISIVKSFTKMTVDVLRNSKNTNMKFLKKTSNHPFFELTLDDLIKI